jgi:hypothetical protein
MPKYKQPSIEEQGGIDAKLDREVDQHNGFASRHFRLFTRLHLPKTIIARLMNVGSPKTIEHWQEHL